MPHIYYTREELLQLLPMLSVSKIFTGTPKGHNRTIDYYVEEKLKQIDVLISSCKNENNIEEDLNREFWKILGSGYELYLMMKVPFRNLPLLINDHRGTPIEDLIKIRFTIGK